MNDLYITILPLPAEYDRDPALEPETPNSGTDAAEELAVSFLVDAGTDPEVDYLIDLYV